MSNKRGDQLDLDAVRGAVVGGQGQQTRDVAGVKTPTTTGDYPSYKKGQKLILRDNDNLEDYIEVDYNPTTWPFSQGVEYNDKEIIGGNDAIEFKGIKRGEIVLELLFTDFGYHGFKNNYKQKTSWKLSWLEGKAQANLHFDKESESYVEAPSVLIIERGIDITRAVITKLEYTVTMQDIMFVPERATVSITFRKVIKRFQRQPGRNGRTG